MGKMLSHLRCHKEALDKYLEAIRLDAHNALAYQAKGDTLLALVVENWSEHVRFYNKAVIAYGAATRIDETLLEAHLGKARTLSQLKRHTEALVVYERILQLDPDNVAASNGKGDQLYQLKQYEQAIAAYDRAIQLDPSFYAARRARTDALQKQQGCLYAWRNIALGALCYSVLAGMFLLITEGLPSFFTHSDLDIRPLLIDLLITIALLLIGVALHLKIVINTHRLLRKNRLVK